MKVITHKQFFDERGPNKTFRLKKSRSSIDTDPEVSINTRRKYSS